MPRWCEHRDLPPTPNMPGGGHIILCHSGPDPRQRCVACGVKGADRLCDWPMGDGKTCDRPLCRRCSRRPLLVFGEPETADIDYCSEHRAMYKARMLEIKKDSPLEG